MCTTGTWTRSSGISPRPSRAGSGSNGCCSTWRACPPTSWSPNWPSTSCCTASCPSPGGYPDRLRQAAHQRWLADARHTLGYARSAYAGRGRLTETAGAIALAFAQGAHATLAARGEWITNEKSLLDRAGFRRADEVLGALTADAGSLVAAVDAASDLIGEAAG